MDTASPFAFYRRLDESAAGGSASTGLFASTPHTRGPWDRHHQHAGPPSALLVRAVERLGHGPQPGLVARATVDILGPIPVDDLRVEARVVREGRKVALCEASLYLRSRVDSPHHADDPEPGVPLARLTAWRLRTLSEPLDVPTTAVEPAPGAGQEQQVPEGWGRGYLDAVEWAWVDGRFEQPGPATVWTRLRVAVVDGETPTPVQRVLAVADSGSGVSAVANPRELLFVNTEVSVHLWRAPVGEAIWLRSRSVLDPAGIGVADTVLGDAQGEIGSGRQSLFVAPRTASR
jgi:hypothetical protein